MHIFDNRWKHGLCGIMLGSILLFTGCASTGPKDVSKEAPAQGSEQASQEKKAEDKISVEYINVVGDGDRVMIGTTGSIKYTVFKLSDPPRLIVDLPGVNLEKVTSPITVNNDYLNDITAVSYGEEKDIGRIVISLKEGVDHDVKSGENSILVSLKKMSAAAPATPEGAVAQAAPAEAKPPAPVKEEAPAVQAPAPKAEEAKPEAKPVAEARQATRILKIDSSKEGANTVLKIVADGAITNFNAFDLDKPDRIVVDVMGVDNAIGKDTVNVANRYVKTVRIGSHPDKARLVFDAAGKKLPPHAVTREGDAIIITLGPKVAPSMPEKTAETAKAAEAAPAPVVPTPVQAPAETKAQEPAPAKPAVQEGIRVERVDFKKVDDKGRLIVSSSSKAPYSVKESEDGKTVVLDLKDATIADELSRTLDASKLKTAVLTVSSYQESVKPKDVRILVKLKDKVQYELKEENGTIYLDFGGAPAPETAGAAAVKEAGADTIKVPTRDYTGKRIDLDMMDANIADVLRLLAEVSNLNIIASDEVKGTISLRLKNVPWDQAFDIILKAKELDSIREGNVVRVAPAAKIRQEREAFMASRKAQEKLENLEIKFVPINYATAADLTKQVKGVLSERGDVTSDSRTNTLIIKDVKSGIAAAQNLITKLDTAIPQVLIEARIVEATSSFARDLGIQWGLDYGTGGHQSTQTFGASGTTGQSTRTQTPNSTISVSGNDQYAVNLPATGTAGTLGALGFLFGKAGRNPLLLDLRLSAGEQEGRLKTISRPRITTMDNKEAKIEQGESIPFETTSASGTATTFVDANLSLTVTPHITPDGSVLMKIKASRNSIGTFRTSGGQPSINKKESSTEVLVLNGETTVIGGIVITDKNETEKGIPFLKDIPVMGWLFKSKSINDSQTELLIFITPTILKEKIVG